MTTLNTDNQLYKRDTRWYARLMSDVWMDLRDGNISQEVFEDKIGDLLDEVRESMRDNEKD